MSLRIFRMFKQLSSAAGELWLNMSPLVCAKIVAHLKVSFKPACATLLAEFCDTITRQQIELESC